VDFVLALCMRPSAEPDLHASSGERGLGNPEWGLRLGNARPAPRFMVLTRAASSWQRLPWRPLGSQHTRYHVPRAPCRKLMRAAGPVDS
jgi:hypothetical protein